MVGRSSFFQCSPAWQDQDSRVATLQRTWLEAERIGAENRGEESAQSAAGIRGFLHDLEGRVEAFQRSEHTETLRHVILLKEVPFLLCFCQFSMAAAHLLWCFRACFSDLFFSSLLGR